MPTSSMNRALRWNCCLHYQIELFCCKMVCDRVLCDMNAVREILLANLSHAKDCKEIKLLAQKFSSLTKHKTLSLAAAAHGSWMSQRSWRRKRRIASSRRPDDASRNENTTINHQRIVYCVRAVCRIWRKCVCAHEFFQESCFGQGH
jgi:hypothetical protein